MEMRTDALWTLNFLIYVQNLYENQIREMEDARRFPYHPGKYIAFKKTFETEFEELWAETVEKIAEHPGNDVKTFHNEQDAYCKSLFAAGDEGVRDFQNTHEAFKVWWDSFAGRFSVERSIDEKRDKLYEKLSAATEGNALNIGIIYDDCRLADTDGAASYAVASIRDFYVNEKELAAKWQKRPG